MVQLREVVSSRDLHEFINFPYRLYRGHPYWVPPLWIDEKNTLSSAKNPAFEYCEARYWLAIKDGRTAGRIAAIRNDKFIKKWEQNYLRFGWMDFEDDPEVAEALFVAVENWAREQGMVAVHGPLGFTDLDREGLLIEGFEERGTLPMIYNYPYYPRYLEKIGYEKDVDWLQFEIAVPEDIGEKFKRLKKLVFERNNLHLLKPSRSKDLLPYGNGIFDVINKAYADLYGVVPLNDQQVRNYIKQYFSFVRAEFIKIIVNEEDEVVAFVVSIPRLTEALQKANGRLLPFGFFHLLRAMQRPKELVFYLIGIRPDYQNKGINAILLSELYDECIRHGIKSVQTCGELEHNSNVITLMKNFDSRLNKRRRCYIKRLDERG
jgi:GNAT superfamily N-acetyltransferase